MRAASRIVFVAIAALQLALVGCGGKSKEEDLNANYVEMPVEQIYDVAFKELQRRRYANAAAAFDEVERQHPYSIWARRSMLMSAYSYYQANKYDDAIESADRFLSLHPGNKDAPYAYYLKAICYYEQISDVGRDQDKTLQALTALQDVVRRYPVSEYARDAQLKIDLTRDHLAGKEMYVGRYYLRHGQYVAAINRFKSVIETYQTTSHVPEALERLTEAYFAVGLNDEAQASAAVLGYNFPDSEWYEDSYALLEERGYATPPPRVQVAHVTAPRPAPVQAKPVKSNAAVPPLGPPPEEEAAPAEQPVQASASETPAASTTVAPASDAQQAAASSSSESQPMALASDPAPTEASAQPPRNDRPGTGPFNRGRPEEDLQDTWSRRLFRRLF